MHICPISSLHAKKYPRDIIYIPSVIFAYALILNKKADFSRYPNTNGLSDKDMASVMTFFLRTRAIVAAITVILFSGAVVCNAASNVSEKGEEKPLLSGRLQGQTGGTLVLELNGTEKLLLTKDGSFTFKTHLAAGEKYSVKIIRPPVNHRCEVKNGEGSVEQVMKDSLAVNCQVTGSWFHPVSLADKLSPAGRDAQTPVVAMDNQGNAIVVWSQYDGNNWRIFKSEYRGNKWLRPATLQDPVSPVGGNAKKPKVAMASNGDVVIVWQQLVSNKISYIMVAEKRQGKWRLPKSIKEHVSYGTNYAWEPEIAMDDGGNTIIVWDQAFKDGRYAVYKSEYRNGAWHHPSSSKDYINVHDGGDGLRPRVVMNNRGDALITWEQDPGGQSRIYKSEYRDGAWHHPADINDYVSSGIKGGRAYNAIPAIDDNRRAVIAWQQTSNSGTRIYKSEYNRGFWHHPTSVADAISPTGRTNASLNSVAMDNKGNLAIIWKLHEKRNQALYLSEFRDGLWRNPLKDDFFVGSKRSFMFRAFGTAALSDSGKAVVAWDQRDDDNISRVFVGEYDNGAWYMPGKQISLGDTLAGNVAVAASKNGSCVVVWLQFDGESNQIYKSEFRVLKKK